MKIAFTADVHYDDFDGSFGRRRLDWDEIDAPVTVVAGDLTVDGTPSQVSKFISDTHSYRSSGRHIICVLGNHDMTPLNGYGEDVTQQLRSVGITVLDGDHYAIDDVLLAGLTGAGGGFGARKASPLFGSKVEHDYAIYAHFEAARLSRAIHKGIVGWSPRAIVAVMHYAPTSAGLRDEARELWPFLGSSEFSDVCSRTSFTVHGHSHRGAFSAGFPNGTPVYNVAVPVQVEERGNWFWVKTV